MRSGENDRAGLAASTLALAVLAYLAACSSAQAAPYTVRFRNPGSARAYETLATCTASGCLEQPVACAPGATCAATVELEPGVHSVWLLGGQGADRTGPSNVREITIAGPPPFDPAACEGAPDSWRADFDGSGGVTASDFGRFLRQFGQ